MDPVELLAASKYELAARLRTLSKTPKPISHMNKSEIIRALQAHYKTQDALASTPLPPVPTGPLPPRPIATTESDTMELTIPMAPTARITKATPRRTTIKSKAAEEAPAAPEPLPSSVKALGHTCNCPDCHRKIRVV